MSVSELTLCAGNSPHSKYICIFIIGRCSNVIDMKRQTLQSAYIDFIDGARIILESEAERDLPILQEIRVHFSAFITKLIEYSPSKFNLSCLRERLFRGRSLRKTAEDP